MDFQNGWPFFWLMAVAVSSTMLIGILTAGAWSGPTVSSLIQLSVRLAVPWLFLAFAASSIQVLFPGPLSLWLARNRKFIGLIFAAAMAWQGLFILWLVIGYTDYYVSEVYLLRDAIEGVLGYLFLAAMTVTSFMPLRKRMSHVAWKFLHKSGIYFLWAYALSTYWWSVFYYEDPVPLDYVYFWLGFAAAAVRIAAWRKKRVKKAQKTGVGEEGSPVYGIVGLGVIGAGLAAAVLSSTWYPLAENVFYGYRLTAWLELYLPYWPFEPYLPLLLVGVGAYITVMPRQHSPA